MHATNLWNIGKILSLQINFGKTFFKTSKPEILNFIIWSDRQAWKQYLRHKGVPTSLLWFQIRGLKNFSAHANFRIMKRLIGHQILLSWSPLLSIYQNKICSILTHDPWLRQYFFFRKWYREIQYRLSVSRVCKISWSMSW